MLLPTHLPLAFSEQGWNLFFLMSALQVPPSQKGYVHLASGMQSAPSQCLTCLLFFFSGTHHSGLSISHEADAQMDFGHFYQGQGEEKPVWVG